MTALRGLQEGFDISKTTYIHIALIALSIVCLAFHAGYLLFYTFIGRCLKRSLRKTYSFFARPCRKCRICKKTQPKQSKKDKEFNSYPIVEDMLERYQAFAKGTHVKGSYSKIGKVEGNKFAPSNEDPPYEGVGAVNNFSVQQRHMIYVDAVNDQNVLGAYPVVFAPEEK